MAAPAGGKSREGAGSDLQILQLLKCAWLNVGQQAWEAGGHDVEPEWQACSGNGTTMKISAVIVQATFVSNSLF